MRLELILQREPEFWNGLETFIDKNREVLEKLKIVKQSRIGIVYVDQKLNIVCDLSEKNTTFYKAVFDELHDKFFLKALIRKVYIWLRLSNVSLRLFMPKKTLNFSLLKGILLLPGNSTYRFYDYRKNKFIIFKKEAGEFVELPKKLSQCDFVIKSSLKNFDNIHYLEEEYFSGVPLNRQVAVDVEQIIPIIEEIENSVEHNIKPSNELAADLEYQVTEVLSYLNSKLSTETFIKISFLIEAIAKRISKVSIKNVLMTASHGDLQPGNILVGSKEIKLIDWEYYSIRIRRYDEFTLRSNIRGRQIRPLRELIEVFGELEVYLFLFTDLSVRLSELRPERVLSTLPSFEQYIDDMMCLLND